MKLFLYAGVAFITTACSWTSPHSETFLGPVLLRLSGPDTNVQQTITCPILLQGGTRWGLHIGSEKRVAVTSATSTNLPFLGPNWRFHPFYAHIHHNTLPELTYESFWGFRVLAGADSSGLLLGGRQSFVLKPNKDALIIVNFSSDKPAQTILRAYDLSKTTNHTIINLK